MDLTDKFIEEVSKIKNPEIFFGVAKILKISLEGEEEGSTKNFNQILMEVIQNYNAAGRQRKRELLKILKDANQGSANGN